MIIIAIIVAYLLFYGAILLFASSKTKYVEHSKYTEISFADGSKTLIGNSAAFGQSVELSNN